MRLLLNDHVRCPLRIQRIGGREVQCTGLQILKPGGSNPSRCSILFLYTHADVLKYYKYYLIYSVVRHMSWMLILYYKIVR